MRSLFKALLASAALSALVFLALSLPSARRSPAASRASDASPVAVAGAQPTGTGPGAGPVPAQATPGDPTAPDVATVPQTAAAPSTRSRAWDPGYLASLRRVSRGEVIRFELVGGEFASGTVRHTEFHDGELLYLAGELTAPEAGRFFFQKQTLPGKAGEFAGVVEFPASRKAYRIEPSGPNGASEMVERSLGDVVCLGLPPRTDAVTEEIPPLDPSDHPDYPVPDYQDGIISLQSLPGATAVLYIDYRGGYTPTWGGITYERPNVSNAEIKDVWKRVAEDYMPFRVNVTTDIKVFQAAPENSRQRVVCTPTTTAAPGAGGVAYLNSWNWTGDTPCWSFYSSGKAAAEVISHEAGHTLTLGHDGRITPSEGYYGGQGSGAVGWAPIMGVGYYQPVAQWSKGEYTSANNTEDDLAKITSNNNAVTYRTDDTGVTLATARYLEMYAGNVGLAEGVIERTGDADAFRFSTTGGLVSLRADPAPGEWADLAIQATLHDAAGNLIASNNPQSQLWASVITSVTNGEYTFRVTGVGRNDPLTDGFSSYASLGYYSVTGYVANARQPSRFTIAENTPNGTSVGTVTANNPGGNPLTYTITAGNTSGAFAINSSGLLTVANSAALNYEALAANTQLTVQYELFVNIVNTINPSLTETNRRVVVQVLDVNEAPVVTGFTNTILVATKPGTKVGTVLATDPDYPTILTYSILSGNSNNLFAIGAQSGVVTVAGASSNALAGTYNLTVQATDNGAGALSGQAAVRIIVATNNTPFAPGSLSYAVYDGIGNGVLVSDLTSNTRFPTDPNAEKQMTSFEGDTDRADNYGAVMRGYVLAPVSGVYTFFIASDDAGELRLSPSTNPASATVIASVSGYTSPREWTKYTTQMSAARNLTAGQAYYLEARMKEGGGGDHVAVAWRGPVNSFRTNVIDGAYLAPYFINYLPKSTGFTGYVRRDAFQGAGVGRVTVQDVNANDLATFTILSGNTEGIFSVDAAGYVRVASEAALQATATPSFTLTIRVTDNGSPALSTTCTASVTVLEAATLGVTSIQREMFYNIGNGTAVSDLTSNAKYPGKPDALAAMSTFAAPADVADNYGSRIRGNLLPTTSGSYLFFIASDDSSQLKLSTSSNPLAATVIASVSGYTAQNVWNTYASQTSGARALVAGQRYYIEALQKEGGGGDHVSVAWSLVGSGVTNIIDAASLEPVDINIAPTIANQNFKVFPTAANGTVIGTVTASDGPLDTLCYKLSAGNSNGIFALDPASGALSVANNTSLADGTVTSAVLTVVAQDSGMGGLYPLHSAQAVVNISLASTNDPFVWSGGGTNNNWSTAANWSGLAPLDGVRLLFGAAIRQTNVNDFTDFTARWLQFNTGGFSLSGNPLELMQGLTNTGNNTLTMPLSLTAAQTWLNSSGTLSVMGPISNGGFSLSLIANADTRLDGPISGSGNLIKSGTGRLFLQGTHPITGALSISTAGGTTSALEVNGAGDLDLSGCTMIMNGRMDLWNHNATVGALNGSGLIFANDGSRTLTIGANNLSGSFTGTLTNSTWAGGVTLGLIKAGTGVQTLTGANAHSGGTTLRAGRISFSNGSALGSGVVTLGDAGTDTNNVILLATAAVTTTNAILVSANGTGAATIGTENLSAGGVNMQFTGPVTFQRDVTLQAGSDDRTTFANRLTGTGNVTVSSPVVGARRVVWNPAAGLSNDFTGDLIVSTNAWLQLGATNSLGNRLVPDATVARFWSGARLRLGPAGSGDGETIGALQSLLPGVGIVEMFTGTAFTLTVGGGNASGSFSGPVINTSGALALTKIGTGTQVLAGVNNFGGAVSVQGGTLVAANNSALGSTALGTTVSTGATLAISNNVSIGAEAITISGTGAGGSGALRNDGGSNTLNGSVTLAGTTTVRALEGSLTLGGVVNAGASLANFNTESGATITLGNALNGATGLIKSGPGTLGIQGTCAISGGTVINGGAVVLGPSGTLGSTPAISLALGATLDASARVGGLVIGAGQTLSGNGLIAGAATINGTLRPGSSIGTLTFSHPVSLAGTTVMELSKTGGVGTNDSLVCGSTLAFGGTLVVTNIGPDALAAGDTFRLFSAGAPATYTFATLVLPPLGGSLQWDTSTLANDGTLRVVTSEPATPPTLAVQTAGSSLTLSWPLDYTSYVLQGQTNALGGGLTGDWQPVPGVISNSFSVPFDPAVGSMFFRLVKP